MPNENDPRGENIARGENVVEAQIDLGEPWDLVSRFTVFLFGSSQCSSSKCILRIIWTNLPS